ncbi:MAG: hypothetical protein ACI4P8_06905 [Akkermansia sp.]
MAADMAGMVFTQIDGSGTTTVTDIAGRTTSVSDASGNMPITGLRYWLTGG